MKNKFNTLPLDHYPLIYAFLDLSELIHLKTTASFFKKNVQHFLDNRASYQNTLKVIDTFMFRLYLLNLHADFLTLTGPAPCALPYLPDTVSSAPPRFSFFHRLLNFLSAYPIESKAIPVQIPPVQIPSDNIAFLRFHTQHIFLIVDRPDLHAWLPLHLLQYKQCLVKILEKNAKMSYRSFYHNNINMRRSALSLVLSGTLYAFFQNDFSKNENLVDTIKALVLLCCIFKLLDILFVSACKNHINTYYPGLFLSNAFLERKLKLFEYFFKKSNNTEEIRQKIDQENQSFSQIQTVANEQPVRKSNDLFFYYQHHHHPHAFKKPATQQRFQAASIHRINAFYAHFVKKNEQENKKSKRLA